MKKMYEVFLKIFATYLFLMFLTSFFGGIIGYLTINDQIFRQSFIANTFIKTGLYLFFSFIIWTNSEKIIKFYTKDEEIDKVDYKKLDKMDFERLKEVSFSIIGLIFFTLHFPRFIRQIYEFFIRINTQLNFDKQFIANIISPLIESLLIVIISIILIFGHKKVFCKIKNLFGNIENKKI